MEIDLNGKSQAPPLWFGLTILAVLVMLAAGIVLAVLAIFF